MISGPQPGAGLVNSGFAQTPIEQARIEKGCQSGRQCQPHVRRDETGPDHRHDQQQIQHDICEHRNDADLDRCSRVLAREVAGRQHLDQREAHQADRVGHQAVGGHLH